ncbi:cellulase [Bacillus sp. AFS002410]|uniref:glycoside hydrolase family 5 protein n=1 Tax=Bacillus sp. AFS002410 TaxID=2033481 RepID=UPI000BF1DC7E|nr:cellulase family glycosylhydrolase [Bacillus sp. AFS002410]PEJ59175.1 cellulase [Bacillus sp. AFS002410]
MKIVKKGIFIGVCLIAIIILLFASSFAFLNYIKVNVHNPSSPLSAGIRGVNWADERDNFVDGVIYVSGLTKNDTYDSAKAVGRQVIGQMFDQTGANTVRLPINEATVENYWSTYTGAIDAALEKGKVIFSYWAPKNGKPEELDRFYKMWSTVINKYGNNPNCYFEPINEPYGYNSKDLRDFYNNWLTKYHVSRKNVILDGIGLAALYINPLGNDKRLDGTMLAVHCYAFYAGYVHIKSLTETGWSNVLSVEIGKYSDRAIVTEWGAPMKTGLDYSVKKSNNDIHYVRAMSEKINHLGIGSVYWPGLRDGDSYSLMEKKVKKKQITLSVTNQSGLEKLQESWGKDTN